MKAIFEVEFDPDMMISEDDLQSDYGGDWFKFMEYMWEQEGDGIFDQKLELVDVKR